MRLAVIGKSGQVASSLAELASERAIEIVQLGRPEFDLTDKNCIGKAIAAAEPDAVVNAAAYTQVDAAETDAATAFAVNATGAEAVARACTLLRVPIIHISTDYVFDGRKAGAYTETDLTCPVNAYGRSKCEGERRVAEACREHIILRTAWVHSPFKQNFVKTMLRLAGERSEVGVVDDQVGSPTYAPHLACAIFAIAQRVVQHAPTARWGIYHAVNEGSASWRDVAEAVFAISRELGGPWTALRGIPSVDYPTAAARPANSRLDTSKIAQVFDVRLDDWRKGVSACVTRLLTAK